MRSDLLRIITRWEQSGQGEGGRDDLEDEVDEEDDEGSFSAAVGSQSATIGSLGGRPARALQTRAAFLNGRPSYLLYFWEVADTHQLLCSSLQRLSYSTGASDAGNVASIAPTSSSSTSHSRKRNQSAGDQHDSQMLRPFVQSMQTFAANQQLLTRDRAKDRLHELQMHHQTQYFRRKAELHDLARKYRKLNAELPTGDERSATLSEFYLSEGRTIEDEINDLERNHRRDLQQQQDEDLDDQQQSSFSDSSSNF